MVGEDHAMTWIPGGKNHWGPPWMLATTRASTRTGFQGQRFSIFIEWLMPLFPPGWPRSSLLATTWILFALNSELKPTLCAIEWEMLYSWLTTYSWFVGHCSPERSVLISLKMALHEPPQRAMPSSVWSSEEWVPICIHWWCWFIGCWVEMLFKCS